MLSNKTWTGENIICVTQYSRIFFRSETIRNKHEMRERERTGIEYFIFLYTR